MAWSYTPWNSIGQQHVKWFVETAWDSMWNTQWNYQGRRRFP